MFLLGAFPAAVLLASLTAIPESPRWLVAQDRPDDAKKVLKLLSASPDDADQVFGVEWRWPYSLAFFLFFCFQNDLSFFEHP
jgi:hypothetical protein